jgi:hypothetical protein
VHLAHQGRRVLVRPDVRHRLVQLGQLRSEQKIEMGSSHQGCQMVYFQTKKSIFGYILEDLGIH